MDTHHFLYIHISNTFSGITNIKKYIHCFNICKDKSNSCASPLHARLLRL